MAQRSKIAVDRQIQPNADFPPLDIPPPNWLIQCSQTPGGFKQLKKNRWGLACWHCFSSNVLLIRKGKATEVAMSVIGKIYKPPDDKIDDDYAKAACVWRLLFQLDAHITIRKIDDKNHEYVGKDGKISKQWESTKPTHFGETDELVSYKHWVQFWNKHVGSALKKMNHAMLLLDASNVRLRHEKHFSAMEEVRHAIKQVGYDKHGIANFPPSPFSSLGRGLFAEGITDEQSMAIRQLKDALKKINAVAPKVSKGQPQSRATWVFSELNNKGGLIESQIAELLIESETVWNQKPCEGYMQTYRKNYESDPNTARTKLIDQVASILKRNP